MTAVNSFVFFLLSPFTDRQRVALRLEGTPWNRHAMETDPWGASADPWGTSSVTASTPEVSPPVPLSTDNQDPILAATLILPRSNSLSESDPWASPNTAKADLGTTPAPITATATEPDERDVPSLSTAGWAVSRDTDDNAWLVKSPTILPETDPSAINPNSETLVAEQVPLPLDEEEDKEDPQPALLSNRSTSENGWGVPQNLDKIHAIAMDTPPFEQVASGFPDEDETLNPFNREDRKPIAGSEDTSTGFSATDLQDDDGFGGFAAGGLRGSSDGFGFANEDDAYGGWGNDNVATNFGEVQDAWESTSAGDAAESGNRESNENPNLEVNSSDIHEEDGFHSIPAKQKAVVTSEQLQEETWEQARRRIEMQEARAVSVNFGSWEMEADGVIIQPIEVINKLVDQWKDVLEQVFLASGSQDTGKEVEDGLDLETIIRKDRYDEIRLPLMLRLMISPGS